MTPKMAAATTVFGFSPAIASFSSPANDCLNPVNFRLSARLYKPPFLASSLTTARVSSALAPKQRNRSFAISGSLSDDSGPNPEEESEDPKEGQIASTDIKLPRRSLLVQFTCNSCGERTNRLVNRLAYERGLVFVQCGGCLRHHKLVDNLGLIVEYDFRDTSKDLGVDHV
ncbi:PREDICTED: DNL-type zinc finger protein [Tarenaya hassleriana]|uniref:DNL-type zinc finger protein n=1 Tax=Tarenaya hassleriana TaxID=28532 RepID=UPI00053C7C48|nr:PREDICTED: DNL-type zinc finger protein [Tarenaya hassleriana]